MSSPNTPSDKMSQGSDDSMSQNENNFIMLLLREIPKEDRTPKEIYILFMKKVISFMNKLNSYEDDPLFSRIRNSITDLENDEINVDRESIYKCAIHQHKYLILSQIDDYLQESYEEEGDTNTEEENENNSESDSMVDNQTPDARQVALYNSHRQSFRNRRLLHPQNSGRLMYPKNIDRDNNEL